MWTVELELTAKPETKLETAVDIPNAMERTFDYPKDRLIISINDIRLRFPLAYVFSDLLGDFLLIINDVLSSESGKGVYGFSQNEVFDADWNVCWDTEKVTITMNSRTIEGAEHEMPPETVSANKVEFLLSWQKVFVSLSDFIDFKRISLDYNDENWIINRLLNIDLHGQNQA